VRLPEQGEAPLAEVLVRKWSVSEQRFVDAAVYELCLPRLPATSLPASA
jgi:hypothetical protein